MVDESTTRGVPRAPWIVIAIGIVLSVGAWQTARRIEDRTVAARIERDAAERTLALELQLDHDLSAVESVAAVFDASPDLGRAEFSSLTAHLLERHRSLRAIGFNPFVRAEGRAAFEEAAQREVPGFRVTERGEDGRLRPATPRARHCVVQYIEPLAGNENALGFDVASEERRRAALDAAHESGEVTLTAGIRLVQDEQREQGVLAFWPTSGMGPDGIEREGFAVGVFRIRDMVEAALAPFEAGALDVAVRDVSAGGELLYASPTEGLESEGAHRQVLAFERAGRRWQVELTPTPAAVAAYSSWVPTATLVSSLWVTGIVAFYLDTLLRRNRRVTHLARARAEEIERRKRAEQERRRLDAKLQQAQRLEGLGALAGGIAHDFNNLLTSMLGHTELAMAGQDASETAEALEQIRSSALQASDLTRQILTYAGRGNIVREPMDLSESITDLLDVARADWGEGAELRVALDPDLPRVDGDPQQIRQLVVNLLTNATEALVGGRGRIDVSTRLQDFDAGTLRDLFGEEGGDAGPRVVLEVRDDGEGMAAATLERVFDPFFSTRREGRGLGLAAAIGIVRGHGGAIDVQSELGEGTRVRVLLPCPPASVDESREGAGELAEGWRGEGTLLVVDDEEPIRRLARRVLEKAGFEVLCAADGQEGVDLFRARSREIDAVLLDMSMPRMSGGDALRQMRAIRPDARIIVASGYDKEDSLRGLGAEGPDAFLQKPFTRSALLRELRHALS